MGKWGEIRTSALQGRKRWKIVVWDFKGATFLGAHTHVCVTVGESEENGKGRVVVVVVDGGPAEVIQFLALPFLPYCSWEC